MRLSNVTVAKLTLTITDYIGIIKAALKLISFPAHPRRGHANPLS